MDKSWMRAHKFSPAYVKGVNTFMEFVGSNMGKDRHVRCPCIKCWNILVHDQKTVKDHIMFAGIDPWYVKWLYHGETNDNNWPIIDKETVEKPLDENDTEYEDDGLHEMFGDFREQYDHVYTDGDNDNNVGGVPANLEELMTGVRTKLYPGCKKISRTSFIIQLLHLKVYNKLSNKTVDMILQLMKSAFPEGETLPTSYYEAKKFLRDLGLGYECIHACKYDCVLYWKENEKLDACPICQTSRWKVNDGMGKKIPHKILRYSPLKPRLQRLFMSEKTSKKMVWHREKRIDDEYTRHPADSAAWKDFDKEYPMFADDPKMLD